MDLQRLGALVALGVPWSISAGMGVEALERRLNYEFTTILIVYVIPIAAILAGVVGALGYFAARCAQGARVAFVDAMIGLLLALGSYLSASTAHYIWMTPEAHWSFSDFIATLQAEMTNAQIGPIVGDNGTPLGGWGYVVEALVMGGYAIGGFMLFLPRMFSGRTGLG